MRGKGAKIGVAISCHNRNKETEYSISQWKKHLPKGCVLEIVDDCSVVPIKEATFRFEKNQGIAQTKNKCLELLEVCDHIFLSDSDTFPIKENWFEPYINSGQKHLCYSFGRLTGESYVIKQVDGVALKVWNTLRGCLLYIHRDVLDVVGGFDDKFIQYGYEHIDFSDRIHRANITPHKCMDVVEKMFFCMDEDSSIKSSYSRKERIFETNNRLVAHLNKSGDCYRGLSHVHRDPVILTAYFTIQKDPQRGTKWTKSIDPIRPLIESCKKLGLKLVIMYDSINQHEMDGEPYPEYIRIAPFKDYTPNVYRRIVFHEYLKYRHHPKVFMVDSTDVEVLKNPFEEISEGMLYVGNELKRVNSPWLNKQGELLDIPDYKEVMDAHGNEQLPNAGIIGGDYDTVFEFTKKNSDIHREYSVGKESTTDMAVFNYVVWKYFKNRMFMGDTVNTVFKKNEYNDTSWFKHK